VGSAENDTMHDALLLTTTPSADGEPGLRGVSGAAPEPEPEPEPAVGLEVGVAGAAPDAPALAFEGEAGAAVDEEEEEAAVGVGAVTTAGDGKVGVLHADSAIFIGVSEAFLKYTLQCRPHTHNAPDVRAVANGAMKWEARGKGRKERRRREAGRT
jgi:hypothetical protein